MLSDPETTQVSVEMHAVHGAWVPSLRLEYASECMLCMLSQHHAIGLQTDCMVTVLAPMADAAKFPQVCPTGLGYGLPPL